MASYYSIDRYSRSSRLCKRPPCLTDPSGILYLFSYDEDEVFIETFRYDEAGKLQPAETPIAERLQALIDTKMRSLGDEAFWDHLNRLCKDEFDVPLRHLRRFGQRFCDRWIRDPDPRLLRQDPQAPHAILDVEALEREGELRTRTPRLFPFRIEKLGVVITEDARLLDAQGHEIDLAGFEALHEAYRRSIEPLIIEREKEFAVIERQLLADVDRIEAWVESMQLDRPWNTLEIHAYDLVTQSEVPITTIYYTPEILRDPERYTFPFPTRHIPVCNLFWYLYLKLGSEILEVPLRFSTVIELFIERNFTIPAGTAKASPW
jgi:hypothetical protein